VALVVDVTLILATAKGVSALESTSGYSGVIVSDVLKVWFDDEVLAIGAGVAVELISLEVSTTGRPDNVEDPLTVLENNV